ncbi:MAG: hypothetical protein ABIV10_12110 [Gemmatimonadaceae bacterium]
MNDTKWVAIEICLLCVREARKMLARVTDQSAVHHRGRRPLGRDDARAGVVSVAKQGRSALPDTLLA